MSRLNCGRSLVGAVFSLIGSVGGATSQPAAFSWFSIMGWRYEVCKVESVLAVA